MRRKLLVANNQLKTVPAKHLKRITTYVEPEIYKQIEARSIAENRSVSNMAATLLTQSTEGQKKAKTNG